MTEEIKNDNLNTEINDNLNNEINSGVDINVEPVDKEDINQLIDMLKDMDKPKSRGRPKLSPEELEKRKQLRENARVKAVAVPKGRPKSSAEELEKRKLERAEEKRKAKENARVGRPRMYKDKDEYLQNQYAQRNFKAELKRLPSTIDEVDRVLDKITNKEKRSKYLDDLLEILVKYDDDLEI
jgi:hypothetical protein